MNEVAVKASSGTAIARPLKVLVPLIKDDLQSGRDAAERAGLPYFRAAGEKMLEAKTQITHGEFGDWVKRNFKIGHSQAAIYMKLAQTSARQISGAPEISSLSEFVRQTGNPNYNKPHTVRPQPWHQDVRDTADRAKREAERLREESLTRAQERDAERQLALRLIDIGFKVLSKELHPDRGGSRDAMQRLNRVRDRLKSCA